MRSFLCFFFSKIIKNYSHYFLISQIKLIEVLEQVSKTFSYFENELIRSISLQLTTIEKIKWTTNNNNVADRWRQVANEDGWMETVASIILTIRNPFFYFKKCWADDDDDDDDACVIAYPRGPAQHQSTALMMLWTNPHRRENKQQYCHHQHRPHKPDQKASSSSSILIHPLSPTPFDQTVTPMKIVTRTICWP